jgi:hypothetical protein
MSIRTRFVANRYHKVKAQIEAFSFFQFYLPVINSGERVIPFHFPFDCCRITGRTTIIVLVLIFVFLQKFFFSYFCTPSTTFVFLYKIRKRNNRGFACPTRKEMTCCACYARGCTLVLRSHALAQLAISFEQKFRT